MLQILYDLVLNANNPWGVITSSESYDKRYSKTFTIPVRPSIYPGTVNYATNVIRA